MHLPAEPRSAWHELGVVVKEAPSIEDAIVKAGLDWKVEMRPLFMAAGNNPLATPVEVTHRASVRDSDGAILGVVGQDHRTVLPNDALTKRPLTAQNYRRTTREGRRTRRPLG